MGVTTLLLVSLLAFANGANDNCKGVATLVGFGTATPRQALIWATLTTIIGAAFSYWFAGGLIKAFSTGVFAAGTALDGAFFASVLIGAIGWVFFATLTGMPVSTTHAIFGGLVGAGLVAFSTGQIRWPELGGKFALPLALSPLLSLAAVYVVTGPVLFLAGRYAGRCACVVEVSAVANSGMAAVSPTLAVVTETTGRCAEAGAVGISVSSTANALHWASSGLIGFARGWNDAPKIAALALSTLAAANVSHATASAFAVVTVAMAVGGLLAGMRVLQTLSRKLTPLPLAESLTASLVTASLVCAASWLALPVSTTHVTTGAIIGAGLKNEPRKVCWGTVRGIAVSWLLTLPAAAVVAAVAKYLMR